MKHKRLMAILLALAMMITFMPAMAFAEGEKLPTPTGLTWMSNNPNTAMWDRYDDYSDIDHFEVTIKFEKAGAEPVTQTVSVGVPNDGYDFNNFFISKGSGNYSFTVKAIAVSGSGKTDSEEASISPVSYSAFKITKKTLDSAGQESQDEGGNAGCYFYDSEGELVGGSGDSENYVFPTGLKAVMSTDVDWGYLLKTMSFETEPDDLVWNDEGCEFTLDKGYSLTVVFQKDDTTADITFDFGEKHIELANKVRELILAEGKYVPDNPGRDNLVIISWPVASSNLEDASNHMDTITCEAFDAIHGAAVARFDQGERWDREDGSFGHKRLIEYADYDVLRADKSAMEKAAVEKCTLYALWAVPASKGNFILSAPVCGNEVTVTGDIYEGLSQTNAPVFRATKDSHLYTPTTDEESLPPTWVKTLDITIGDLIDGTAFYEGTITGGADYYAGARLLPKPGYYVDPDLPMTISVNGATPKIINLQYSSRYMVATISAKHIWELVNGGRKCKECGAFEAGMFEPLMATMKASGKKNVRLTWNQYAGADGYDVFLAKCNTKKKKYTCENVASLDAGVTSWKAVGLSKRAAYKAYVQAYVLKNGTKTYVAKSPVVHAFTGGYTKRFTNPKSLKLRSSKLTVKKGKTRKIKAYVRKLKKGKKLMSSGHARKLRYMSTDISVAKVSKYGKIKGVSKGTCKVYVYTVNGIWKSMNVTVK